MSDELNSGEIDTLDRARQTAAWDAAQGPATSHSPDERTVPALLAGILDALIAVAERLPDTRVTSPGSTQEADQ